MTTYRHANRTAQWFSDSYGSATWAHPEVGVIHSTETTGWPGYKSGASAPNYTARPNIAARTLEWRAHFEDEESSRALVNLAGGVETNTARAIQVELIGTCDPRHRTSWAGAGKSLAGRDYLYLPDAPAWYLEALAAFVRDMHTRHGIPMVSPLTWRAYPSSYGASPVRMSHASWRAFRGWCGHQHVPENTHGDPGNFAMGRVLELARGTTTLPTTPTPTPTWEDTEMLSPEALAQVRAVVREELDAEQTARQLFTGHAIVKDTRSPVPDLAPRVTPSTLLEAAAARPATTEEVPS